MKLAVLLFIEERFHPKVSVLLAVILFSTPFATVTKNHINYFSGLISAFLIFLALRMADDLTSISEDRITHSKRGLVSGKINIQELWWSLTFLLILIFFIAFLNYQISFILILLLYYGLFFCLKNHIPIFVSPFLSNFIFLFLPYFATNTLELGVNKILYLGLFLWTSAIAHEFSHNAYDSAKKTVNIKRYSNFIGSRNTAILSLVIFVCSLIFAVLFWNLSKRPVLFICILIPTTFQMLYLYYKLIRFPSQRNAKPFYVFGFAFFLLPCCAYIIDSFYSG